MKRFFAIIFVIGLVFSLGLLLGYFDGADISLVSDSLPAISVGGSVR